MKLVLSIQMWLTGREASPTQREDEWLICKRPATPLGRSESSGSARWAGASPPTSTAPVCCVRPSTSIRRHSGAPAFPPMSASLPPSEIGDACDTVLFVVPASPQIESCLSGPDGLLVARERRPGSGRPHDLLSGRHAAARTHGGAGRPRLCRLRHDRRRRRRGCRDADPDGGRRRRGGRARAAGPGEDREPHLPCRAERRRAQPEARPQHGAAYGLPRHLRGMPRRRARRDRPGERPSKCSTPGTPAASSPRCGSRSTSCRARSTAGPRCRTWPRTSGWRPALRGRWVRRRSTARSPPRCCEKAVAEGMGGEDFTLLYRRIDELLEARGRDGEAGA